MRIDAHQHFWNYDPVRDSWINDDMKSIRKDFLPKELKDILNQHNFSGCIAIQASQSEEETLYLLGKSITYPFIRGVVGWVDLCADNLEERLAFFTKNIIFKGVRHVLQAEDTSFMTKPSFKRGIGMLAKYNLTYDILIYPEQIDAVIELVSAFPEQHFVIDHMAKPAIKNKEITKWAVGISKLATFPNIYCKVSGMVTEADWGTWTFMDIKPYLDVVFNAFGVDRILYGSDWPVCLLASSYEEQLTVVRDYIAKFSDEEQELILGGNAAKFYNLKS